MACLLVAQSRGHGKLNTIGDKETLASGGHVIGSYSYLSEITFVDPS